MEGSPTIRRGYRRTRAPVRAGGRATQSWHACRHRGECRAQWMWIGARISSRSPAMKMLLAVCLVATLMPGRSHAYEVRTHDRITEIAVGKSRIATDVSLLAAGPPGEPIRWAPQARGAPCAPDPERGGGGAGHRRRWRRHHHRGLNRVTPFMRGAFVGEMARGRQVFPILGNCHPRPFGKNIFRTGGQYAQPQSRS